MKTLQITAFYVGLALVPTYALELPELTYPMDVFHAPTSIPEWLKGHEDLLPPVAPAIVKEMSNLMNYWGLYSNEGGGFVPQEYQADTNRAIARIAELQQTATEAMLWLYTYERPKLGADNQRARILHELFDDPTILNYSMPLFRQRVAWLTEQDAADKEANTGAGEVHALMILFLTWGNEDDIEVFRKMLIGMNTLYQNKVHTQSIHPLLEEFTREIEGPYSGYFKKDHRRSPRPTWKRLTMNWKILYGPEEEAKYAALYPITATPMPVKQSPVVAAVPPMKAPPVPEPQDHSWMLWLLAVFAALGGVFWLMRKPLK